MSGVSLGSPEPSPGCARLNIGSQFNFLSPEVGRMKHILGLPLAEMALAALFGAALSLISPANAQTFGSSYTSTAPKDCRMIGKPSELDGSTTRVCPGKSGLVVLIAEDDLRETVSVGRNRIQAAREPAAQIWF